MRNEPMSWEKIKNTALETIAIIRGQFSFELCVQENYYDDNGRIVHCVDIVERRTDETEGDYSRTRDYLIVRFAPFSHRRELRWLVLSAKLIHEEEGDKAHKIAEKLARALRLKLKYVRAPLDEYLKAHKGTNYGLRGH